MIWRIDVFPKEEKPREDIQSQIKDLGISKDFKCYYRKVYLLDSDFGEKDAELLASQILIDPVIEEYNLSRGVFSEPPPVNHLLITYNPGVSDPVAISLEKAIRDLSLEVRSARIVRFYSLEGLDRSDIEFAAEKVFYNPLIEHILEYEKTRDVTTLEDFSGGGYEFELNEIKMLEAADGELNDISRNGCLSLNLEEMKAIQNYFRLLGRNPTDCELETLATLWSEHCAHKTFRGLIRYEELDTCGSKIGEEVIDNLLKSTISKATKEINSPGCVSVFVDNSGIVKFDDKSNICFKVETHNHPSSLEPYGGASTGIGGVIRDILGTGCAARPFASTDVFCFSPWEIEYNDLPRGLLHPKRIIRGVIRGVRDYGNRMGIPTVSGAVLFDTRFLGNPLVYCGTLGIMPKEKSFKKAEPGDLIILCGARTGRDGIHGATFSSKELDEHTVGLTSAVQIGNAIEEKKLTEAIIRARDENLFTAITDCGAGGISSAITELAREWGASVELEKVPLKYKGLSYTEIWISESQERMVFFSKEDNLDRLKKIFEEEDVDLTVVGRVGDSHKLILSYENNRVCELDMDFIFNLPREEKRACWVKKKEEYKRLGQKEDYSQDLAALLARPNIAPKDWILREYDHEVQSGSVVKSISGIGKVAVNDSAVVRPDLGSDKCVAVGVGINPFYSDIDPYWMSALAIDEALRNLICVGARLDETYMLDNFSWGSPLDASILGGLVRAAKACHDFALYFGIPFISGKDSLYNEYMVGKKHISVPGTLLISAVSVIEHWQKSLTAEFKQAGNLIYIAGVTNPEMGASEYFRYLGVEGGFVPKVDKAARDIFVNLSKAIDRGLVKSCHDLAEGGLAVCLSEMCMGSGLGASVFLSEAPKKQEMLDYELLFSESPSRFLIEVEKTARKEFESTMGDLPLGLIGCVSKEATLSIFNSKNREVVKNGLDLLKKAWISAFEDFR